jgi:hypothetical protein
VHERTIRDYGFRVALRVVQATDMHSLGQGDRSVRYILPADYMEILMGKLEVQFRLLVAAQSSKLHLQYATIVNDAVHDRNGCSCTVFVPSLSLCPSALSFLSV